MKLRYALAITYMLLVAGCFGSSYKVIGNYDPTQQSFSGVVVPSDANAGEGCPPLPEDFKESDLIGTWGFFTTGTGGVVTITLQANGTYKLIYDYPLTGYHYEGDWKKWHLERRDNGTALVRFQEMPICGRTCKPLYSGVVVDSCEHYKRVPIKDNEVGLILTGSPPPDSNLPADSPINALHGIEMFDPSLDPDSGGITYRLKR